jgi:hypothetical protein
MSTERRNWSNRMSAYELRIYQVAENEMATLETIFRELVLPMLPDFGIGSVGYWKSPDDSTFHYVVEHNGLATINLNWDRFHADPRWASGLQNLRRNRTVVKDVQSTRLIGIAGLPPAG